MRRFETLHHLLAANARDDRHITFIDGENEQHTLTFTWLRRRALAVLGALQRKGLRRGDAVVLYLTDNERFLEMFWACTLGGIVTVPLATGGTDEHRHKLFRVYQQFERAWVYIDAASFERIDDFASAQGLGEQWQRLRSDSMVPGSLDITGAPGEPVSVGPDDLAFIQYSSGSTGQPKGVMLTHRNLVANIASIIEAARFTDRDIAFSWMPLSHDMGLIGFHLNMVGAGVAHAIMRTELFARRPLLWLELATSLRSTVLCSPNFGYQHYLKQAATRAPRNVDLAAVRLIFNGAEPISAELCRRFVQAMLPFGLSKGAMFPVYGLAESSLAVSFPEPGSPLETVTLDRSSLQIGREARLAAAGGDRLSEFVKLGSAIPDVEIRVVDDAGTVLAGNHLGHVAVRGENVTRGYYRDPEATAGALSPDGWLDTGDLGMIHDGQLVITGRAKDLVIVNGQNFYPHDIERIAEQIDGIDANRVVASGVRTAQSDTEELVLFVLHRGSIEDFAGKARAIRRAVDQQMGLEIAHVVPVSRIPKTTSGKLQRYALADEFERGDYAEVLKNLAPLLYSNDSAPTSDLGATLTTQRLREICAALVPDKVITPQTNLMEINLNSLSLARIHEAIEREYPRRIEVTDLFEYPTLELLGAFLDRKG
ncbi:mutanobactin A non-ribosomal peptide synthetase MubE [soil metagenome]